MPADFPPSDSGGAIRTLSDIWWSSAGAEYLRICRDVARGIESHVGTEYGTSAGAGDPLGREVESLRRWARETGRLFDSKIIPLLNRGGREHYIVEPFEDHR